MSCHSCPYLVSVARGWRGANGPEGGKCSAWNTLGSSVRGTRPRDVEGRERQIGGRGIIASRNRIWGATASLVRSGRVTISLTFEDNIAGVDKDTNPTVKLLLATGSSLTAAQTSFDGESWSR